MTEGGKEAKCNIKMVKSNHHGTVPESASEMEWEYVVVELKLIEESGLATCFGLSEVLIKWAKFGVKPQFGSVGVVGSFLVTEIRK